MPAEWGQITAREILEPTRGKLVSGSPETNLRGISIDSRTVRPRELFWALKGDRFDGHDFSSKALERGAGGIVVRESHPVLSVLGSDPVVVAVGDTERALGDFAGWWRKERQVRVIAIARSKQR